MNTCSPWGEAVTVAATVAVTVAATVAVAAAAGPAALGMLVAMRAEVAERVDLVAHTEGQVVQAVSAVTSAGRQSHRRC